MLHSKYLQFLQWLCRREMKRIADNYPMTRSDLIKYHDHMALMCINSETKTQSRVLGISLRTAEMLEDPNIN